MKLKYNFIQYSDDAYLHSSISIIYSIT
jgi:hypothetical protein